LNQALAARNLLPREVQLTILRPAQKEFVMESRHKFSWRLNDSDLEKIKMANDAAIRFRPVTLDEYRRIQ
jgi:hypothetical protein